MARQALKLIPRKENISMALLETIPTVMDRLIQQAMMTFYL
jgi:retron-type reverse transcriptase